MGRSKVAKNPSTPPHASNKKIRPSGWQVFMVGFFLFYMLVPIISTYIFSVATRWDRTILPEGYTFEFYKKAFDASYFTITLRNSLILSVASVLASLLVIVPTVYWVHTRLASAKPLLEVLMILPFGIP